MRRTVVLDTDVVIGALDALDAHHADAAALVLGLVDQGAALAMSVVNYAETLVRPGADEAAVAAIDRALATLGVDLVAPDQQIARDAARLRGGVSLGDAFALATARRLGAEVATFDRRVRSALPGAGLTAPR